MKELETAWSSASKLEEKSWVAKQAGEADMLVTVTVQFGKSSTILSAVAMLVLQSTNLEIVYRILPHGSNINNLG